MRKALLVLALLLLTLLFGCAKSDATLANTKKVTPPENPATRVAELEDEFQIGSDFDYESRAQARQAAIEFVKANLPKWIIKGVSSRQYQANIFWVDVDIERENQRLILSLNVQKFFPETGEAYWRAAVLTEDVKERLHKMNDADLIKRLEETQEKLSNLQSSK
jgi:hypothetical protein